MQNQKRLHLRWADLDPNFHLRHSAYYDLAAQFRMEFLNGIGLNLAFFQQHQINPVLLKEECTFKREIKYQDEIDIQVELLKVSADYKKYQIRNVFKRPDQTICAELVVFGGWFHVPTRKLSVPPQALIDSLEQMPKHENFDMSL